MNESVLEHINLTVPDPQATADLLCELFGWHVRWQGEAKNAGFTIHVGGHGSYLALYRHQDMAVDATQSHYRQHGLNHVGIVVDNLDAAEKRVIERGLEPHSHADYEPGRRFYFHDEDGLEFEVISYAADA
ncbi:VOC family protein [Granulosicoccus sp. 3-233]|uniref:VOC family protein n=1 Tax=Granulosicoccus sp. 3-233 TaxID=3417969 RepID=UPI003D34FFC0